MIINESNLKGIKTTFDTLFRKGIDLAEPNYKQLATIMPSTGAETNHKWIGGVPKMREWIGDRQHRNLSAYQHVIVNKDFESSVEIDRNDLEDDLIGVYNPTLQELGDEAAFHPDDLIWDLLNKGDGTTLGAAHDGKAFFANNHTEGDSGTIDNLDDLPLNPSNFMAVRARGRKFNNDQGRTLRVFSKVLLVVPPALEEMAIRIRDAQIIGHFTTAPGDIGGVAGVVAETNVRRKFLDYLVAPEIDTDTHWYMFDVSKPIKPVIFQTRSGPTLVSYTSPTDAVVYNTRMYQYGVDYRGNAGYGLYWLAIKSLGTA